MAHPGDDFFDLIRRLGDCYVNDVQRHADVSASVNSYSHRKNSQEEGPKMGWLSGSNSPRPPAESKTLPKPSRGPDLLPAIDNWKRQISSPAAARSGRPNDTSFADDFWKALQRKVTFEMSELTKGGSLTSKELDLLGTRSQPMPKIAFEPREFWKRKSDNNPLTVPTRSTRNAISSKILVGSVNGRSSWSSVVAGCDTSNLILHPISIFKSTWSIIGMLFLIFDIIVIPLRFFDFPDWSFADVMNLVTLLYWNIDIFVSFMTGYYHRGILVMKPKRIALHYLRTWFLMDITVVTVDWLLTSIAARQEGSGAAGVARLSKTLRLLRFVRLLRMFRVARGNALVQHFEENTFSQATLTHYSILKITGYIILLQHVIACLWFLVGSVEPGTTWLDVANVRTASVTFQYYTCLHWAFAQLGAANVEIEAYNVLERGFCVGVALVSLISTSALVSTITSLLTSLEQRRNDEMNQFTRLRRFLQYNGIPGDLRDRVTRFLQYAYHSQTECTLDSDVPLLKLLSKGLHAELQFSRYEEALGRVTFLKSLMKSNRQTFQESKVLQSLAVKALHMVDLAQNDVIFCAGGVAESSYLVLSGSFSYVRRGKYCSPSDSSWIGDNCLWTPWLYVGELLAREIGRLVALEAETFCECVGAVWEMRQQAAFFALTVVDDLNTVELEDLTDVKEEEEEEAKTVKQASRRDSRMSSDTLASFQIRCSWWCCRRQDDFAQVTPTPSPSDDVQSAPSDAVPRAPSTRHQK